MPRPTLRELEEENACLREALEQASDLIADALSDSDEEEDD